MNAALWFAIQAAMLCNRVFPRERLPATYALCVSHYEECIKKTPPRACLEELKQALKPSCGDQFKGL